MSSSEQAAATLTPEQEVALAKQRKKDNELKKKQAAEEWKRQQALKASAASGQPAPESAATSTVVASENLKPETLIVDAKTNEKAKKETKEPEATKVAPSAKPQAPAGNPRQQRSTNQGSQSKLEGLHAHLKPIEPVSLKSIREKFATHPYASSLMHHAMLSVCLKYNKDQIIGSNERCVTFLNALKEVINDFQAKEGSVFYKDLNVCIDHLYTFLETFRSIPEGLKTIFKYVKNIIGSLVKSQISHEQQKKWICLQIDYFIQKKITTAQENIINFGQEMIKNGDSIIVYARSQVVENLLIEAHKKGKRFTVIVVDNPPFNEGKILMERLSENGVETIYTLLSNMPYFIKKASKVFVGALSMLTNGALVSRVGTALMACVAHEFRTPFHVFCESYKFSEKSQLDSLSFNEISKPIKKQGETTNTNEVHLRYDLTPCELVSMILPVELETNFNYQFQLGKMMQVVTELGPVPPTAVQAIIREFTSYGYVGKIELPTE